MWPPRAALIGSRSPMMSAIVTSGRRQLLQVALFAIQPLDGRVVAVLRDHRAAVLRDRRQGVVVHLAPRDHGHPGIQQSRQLPQNPALRLPPQAQQDEVVTGQNRVRQLRNDRIVVAPDAGEERLAGLEFGDQALAQFVLDRTRAVAGGLKGAEGGGSRSGGGCGRAHGGKLTPMKPTTRIHPARHQPGLPMERLILSGPPDAEAVPLDVVFVGGGSRGARGGD